MSKDKPEATSEDNKDSGCIVFQEGSTIEGQVGQMPSEDQKLLKDGFVKDVSGELLHIDDIIPASSSSYVSNAMYAPGLKLVGGETPDLTLGNGYLTAVKFSDGEKVQFTGKPDSSGVVVIQGSSVISASVGEIMPLKSLELKKPGEVFLQDICRAKKLIIKSPGVTLYFMQDFEGDIIFNYPDTIIAIADGITVKGDFINESKNKFAGTIIFSGAGKIIGNVGELLQKGIEKIEKCFNGEVFIQGYVNAHEKDAAIEVRNGLKDLAACVPHAISSDSELADEEYDTEFTGNMLIAPDNIV